VNLLDCRPPRAYRQGMVALLAYTLVVLAVFGALAYAAGLAMGRRGEAARDRLSTRWRHRGGRLEPQSRPIEAIARDLRRLGNRFYGLDPHASYAKTEAVRGAYDKTLAECCAALGLTHLLAILPAGPELDAERQRVEDQLTDAGVRFPHPA
jgi:hypothetical protein